MALLLFVGWTCFEQEPARLQNLLSTLIFDSSRVFYRLPGPITIMMELSNGHSPENKNGTDIKNGVEELELFRRTQVPPINEETVRNICMDYFGLNPERIENLNGYNDRNFRLTNVRNLNSNPNLKEICQHGYVIKIQCIEDTEVENLIEGQNAVLRHLKAKGLPVQEVVTSKNGNDLIRMFVNYAMKNGEKNAGGVHAIRIFCYIPGQLLQSVPTGGEMFYKVGQLQARVHNTLKDFNHPGFEYTPSTMFCLYNVRFIRKILHVVKDEDKRRMVTEVLDAFHSDVFSKMDWLEQGQIHGDFFDPNLLIHQNENGNIELCGLLDIGDTHRTCLIFDVAIGIACMMMMESSTVPIVEIGGHFLAGYLMEKRLPKRDLRLLRTCICARYCLSLVFGLDIYWRNPQNEYALYTQKRGWPQLTALWQTPEMELYETWNRVLSMYSINNVF